MSLSGYARRTLSFALASDSAAHEIAAAIDAGGLSEPQSLASTDSPTFVNLTLGGTASVAGAATLHNTAITGTLSTSGAATLASGVVTAGLTVGTTLGVTGIATFSNDINIASGKVIKVNNVQVVGAQQTAVTPVAVTFSANAPATYGTPTGLLTVADGTTPTVVELVKYCNELRKNIVDLQAVLHAHGLTS